MLTVMARVAATFWLLFSIFVVVLVTVVVLRTMENWFGFWPTFTISMICVICGMFWISGHDP